MILFFLNTNKQHYADLIKIIYILYNMLFESNMKISLGKSKFFKLETDVLGYIVSHNLIKTDPEKIATSTKYPIPSNIRKL